mgnify:CR=1 FL=1
MISKAQIFIQIGLDRFDENLVASACCINVSMPTLPGRLRYGTSHQGRQTEGLGLVAERTLSP